MWESLNRLKTRMWWHSNMVINNIIDFTEQSKLENKDIVEEKIEWNIKNFLETKYEIEEEYGKEWEPGDSLFFQNRKLYRENMKSIISDILEASKGKQLSNEANKVKEKLIDILNTNN